MKKNLKKLASLALALIMVLALAVPAMATEGPTAKIIIENTLDGKSYDIYKIFDMTVNSDKKVAYDIAEGWEDFFTLGKGAEYLSDEAVEGAALLNVGGATKYLSLPEIDPDAETPQEKSVVTFASAALTYALETEGLEAAETLTGNGGSVEADLPYGYYLTYLRGATDKTADSDGSLCALNNVTGDVTLKIKATLPTIDKTAENGQPAVVKGVGDTVTFTITGQVPDTTNFTTYIYKVSDNMTEGLTFQKNVSVKIGDEEIDVTPEYETEANPNGFELTLTKEHFAGKDVGAPIVITYTAVINEKAIERDSETNTAKLNYSNDPNDPTGEGTTGATVPVVVKIFTTTLDVDKYALNASDTTDTSAKLGGAKFVLYKEVTEGEGEDATTTKLYYVKNAEGEISWTEDAEQATVRTTVFNDNETEDDTSDDTALLDGKFDGLGNGTYYLEEIEAPAGYNKMATPEKVVIDVQPETVEGEEPTANEAELISSTTTTDAEGNVITVNKYIVKANLNKVVSIQNSTGSELPETGGIGTTIFYVVGGLLAVGAVVLLITKRRTSVDDE